MLARPNDNNEAAHLLADEEQPTKSDVLPRDVWVYLLQFCSLETIGRLARVDSNLNRVVKNANLEKEFEAKIMLMSYQRLSPGYVKGSYTNLKAFFAARQNDEQRIEKLNNSCCIDSADCCCITGAVGSGFFCLVGAFTVGWTVAYSLGTKDVFSIALFGGMTGGLSFGPVALCVSCSAERRDAERKSLKTQLQSKPTNLHGTMFSWIPTMSDQDLVPAKLMMN